MIPSFEWLRQYRAAWLPGDLVAGLTLAAYAIPVGLAYASLAGLPPQHGVYGYLIGGVAYAVFGSSRQLAIGPTSAISLLVGTTVAGMAGGDPARFLGIASLVALVFAVICVIAWLLRLSSLVDFISETILVGFKAGAAFTIAMTQLPKLFGVKGGGEHFFERCLALLQQLPQTNLVVLAFGLVAVAVLLLGERLLPAKPVALGVVAIAILLLTLTPPATFGFKTVGVIPEGLPVFGLPSLRLSDIDGAVSLAMACFLLAYIETVSAGRTLAARHGYEIDPRQELLALGAANAAVAFGQGYPVAGGLSQSSVNDKAGARTPLALVFASAAIAACLLFLTGLVRNLPDVVLAAIVLVAVKGLVNVAELRRIWRLSRAEFGVAAAAFAGVLMLGILRGVLLAAVFSMLLLIRRVARPNVARLGRVPGTDRFSDVARHPDNQVEPATLVIRVEASLLYFNVTHVRDELRRLVTACGTGLRRVVWDLSTSPHVDIAGVDLIGEFHRELETRGAMLRIVEARGSVRDLIRSELGVGVGEVSRRRSLSDAVTGDGPAT